MTRPRRLAAAVLAGLGAFVVDGWPDLLVWRAARSGSAGDVDEVGLAGVGLALSALLAVAVAWIMHRGLERGARSPRLGRFDVWGAYALGLGVHSVLLVSLVPAALFVVLLTDENRSVAEQQWRLLLVWGVTRVAAAALGVLAGRALLGRRLVPSRRTPGPGRAGPGPVSARRVDPTSRA